VAGTSLVSSYPINIMYTQYVDIVCPQLLQFGFSSYSSDKRTKSKVLKRVYVNDMIPYGNVNIIYDVPRVFLYCANTNLPDLELQLYDDQKELLVGFNNANISMQIDCYKNI
jgi:hypothetical protein